VGLVKPYYQENGITIYHGDCREILPSIQADIVITDPPYGLTDYEWDLVVDPSEWMIAVGCVSFASEPFATSLINASPLKFKHDLVWVRNTASGHFNSWIRPRRQHERILVFGSVDYSPIKIKRTTLEMSRLNKSQRAMYPEKMPGTVLYFNGLNNRNSERVHPSQKPVDLMDWLLRTYAPKGMVCDPFCGSGSTLVSASRIGNDAVGVEREERYCELAANRLRRHAGLKLEQPA
jgi:DNA modification methylase